MPRFVPLFLAALLAVTLFGCAPEPTAASVRGSSSNAGADIAPADGENPPAPVPAPAPAPSIQPDRVGKTPITLPTIDRNPLHAKFLPILAKANAEPAKPLPTPKSALLDNKPTPLTGDLLAKVTRLRQWAGYLRGKKLKADVACAQMTEKEVADMLTAEVGKELPPEWMYGQEESGIALGFFPDNLDVTAIMVRLVAAGVGAFYDPQSKYFVMVQHTAKPGTDGLMSQFAQLSDEITSVHEFTHAVQDQYFDLVKLLPPDKPNDEGQAIRALVEGDATFVMMEYGLARAEGGQKRPDLLSRGSGDQLVEAMGASMSQMDDNPMVPESMATTMKLAPRILTEELLFSYSRGFAFVYALHKAAHKNGFKGEVQSLDDAFRNPPQSTEQILHPEKYLDPDKFDAPEILSDLDLTTVEKGLPKEYVKVGSDELGEFRMRLWFEEILRGGLYTRRDGVTAKPRPQATAKMQAQAATAAAGWDGCRVTVYQKLLEDNKVHTVLTVVADFDTIKDCDEAAALFVERMKQMAPADAKTEEQYFGLHLYSRDHPDAIDAHATVGALHEYSVQGVFGTHAVLTTAKRLVYIQDAEGTTAIALGLLLRDKTTAEELKRPAPAAAPTPAPEPEPAHVE